MNPRNSVQPNPPPLRRQLQSSSSSFCRTGAQKTGSKNSRLLRFGTYNVGWVGARNDPDGFEAVTWWRQKCIEWCHDYVDGDPVNPVEKTDYWTFARDIRSADPNWVLIATSSG